MGSYDISAWPYLMEFPGLSIGEVAKKLGTMWKEIEPEEKKRFEEKSKVLKVGWCRLTLSTPR
jgi:hypothetical protein